jgi:hypothetical protein
MVNGSLGHDVTNILRLCVHQVLLQEHFLVVGEGSER